jgi:hypothetical protein
MSTSASRKNSIRAIGAPLCVCLTLSVAIFYLAAVPTVASAAEVPYASQMVQVDNAAASAGDCDTQATADDTQDADQAQAASTAQNASMLAGDSEVQAAAASQTTDSAASTSANTGFIQLADAEASSDSSSGDSEGGIDIYHIFTLALIGVGCALLVAFTAGKREERSRRNKQLDKKSKKK